MKADIATVRYWRTYIDEEGNRQHTTEFVIVPPTVVITEADMRHVEELARSAAEYVPCVLLVNGRPVTRYTAVPASAPVVIEEYREEVQP